MTALLAHTDEIVWCYALCEPKQRIHESTLFAKKLPGAPSGLDFLLQILDSIKSPQHLEKNAGKIFHSSYAVAIIVFFFSFNFQAE